MSCVSQTLPERNPHPHDDRLSAWRAAVETTERLREDRLARTVRWFRQQPDREYVARLAELDEAAKVLASANRCFFGLQGLKKAGVIITNWRRSRDNCLGVCIIVVSQPFTTLFERDPGEEFARELFRAAASRWHHREDFSIGLDIIDANKARRARLFEG